MFFTACWDDMRREIPSPLLGKGIILFNQRHLCRNTCTTMILVFDSALPFTGIIRNYKRVKMLICLYNTVTKSRQHSFLLKVFVIFFLINVLTIKVYLLQNESPLVCNTVFRAWNS